MIFYNIMDTMAVTLEYPLLNIQNRIAPYHSIMSYIDTNFLLSMLFLVLNFLSGGLIVKFPKSS